MGPTMDEDFSRALRAALLDRVTPPRRRRWFALGAGAALAIAVPGTAAAYQLLQPGVNEIDVAAPVEATYTGTARVPLGDRPPDATQVQLSITCVTAGRIEFEDGASSTCGAGEWTGYTIPLGAETDSVLITARDDMVWQLTATYQDRVVTPHAVNDRGETFGVENERYGRPDLIGAVASNGRDGYIRATDLDEAMGPMPDTPEEAVALNDRPRPDPLTVYLSDGETVIGEFPIG